MMMTTVPSAGRRRGRQRDEEVTAAHDVVVVFPLLPPNEPKEDGILLVSQLVLSPDGRLFEHFDDDLLELSRAFSNCHGLAIHHQRRRHPSTPPHPIRSRCHNNEEEDEDGPKEYEDLVTHFSVTAGQVLMMTNTFHSPFYIQPALLLSLTRSG